MRLDDETARLIRAMCRACMDEGLQFEEKADDRATWRPILAKACVIAGSDRDELRDLRLTPGEER